MHSLTWSTVAAIVECLLWLS